MEKWAPVVIPPKLNGRVLDRMLPMLVGLNVDFLRENPNTPPIYQSGVRYVREPKGQERWLSIPWVLARKGGDCEDLATWRAAELQVRRRENAKAIWSVRKLPQGGCLYHIRVQRADGRVEDPSLLLGMGMPQYGETHSITPNRGRNS